MTISLGDWIYLMQKLDNIERTLEEIKSTQNELIEVLTEEEIPKETPKRSIRKTDEL